MKTLFVTNDLHDAINSRIELKKWVKKKYNYDIDICAPFSKKLNSSEEILYLSNRGFSLNNILTINNLIKQDTYETIVFRGIENILLSLFVSHSSKIKVIFLLTGLGKLFAEDLKFKTVVRYIYKFLLRKIIDLKKANLIVQNKQDAHDLNMPRTSIIDGSGYSKKINIVNNLDLTTPTVITATRLIKSKGLDEILMLCKLIIRKNLKVKYIILGDYSHLSIDYQKLISEFKKEPNINFIGFTKDINKYISKSNFAYYPTKYREGVPRFLIESLAHGLVVFTNSMPGCLKVVSSNNGYLDLSPREVIELIIKMDSRSYKDKSISSRELFNNYYDVSVVYPKYYKNFRENEK